MVKVQRWRCLVCGFVAKGDMPPEVCPACGAGAEQFVCIELQVLGFVVDVIKAFAPHQVATHFSSGLIPLAAFFLFLWYATGHGSFEIASFYTLCVAVVSLPVATVTGLVSWQGRYAGRKLPVFKVKLVFSALLIVTGVVAVALRFLAGAPTLLYSLLVGVMFVLVVVLGHLGGKLVFYWKKTE